MALALHNLKPAARSRRARKRVGRGNASGHGTTATRGQKGQTSRTGVSRLKLKRLGMKATLQATPKVRGFKAQYAQAPTVPLEALADIAPDGARISPKTLVKWGLIPHARFGAKLIGATKIAKRFTVTGCRATAQAKAQIEAAGGTVTDGAAKSA